MSSCLCGCFGIQQLLLQKRYQLIHGSSQGSWSDLAPIHYHLIGALLLLEEFCLIDALVSQSQGVCRQTSEDRFGFQRCEAVLLLSYTRSGSSDNLYYFIRRICLWWIDIVVHPVATRVDVLAQTDEISLSLLTDVMVTLEEWLILLRYCLLRLSGDTILRLRCSLIIWGSVRALLAERLCLCTRLLNLRFFH
jgi:hypothetical protein